MIDHTSQSPQLAVEADPHSGERQSWHSLFFVLLAFSLGLIDPENDPLCQPEQLSTEQFCKSERKKG